MKDLRTEIRPRPSTRLFGLKTPILTIGSCFADAIGSRLAKYKFSSLVNPFGVIYNPISIHKALDFATLDKTPAPDSLIQRDEVWVSFDFHSEISALEPETLQRTIGQRISQARMFIKSDVRVIITYGTAWAYRRVDTGEIVANCHKLPGNTFSRFLLSENEIEEAFRRSYDAIRSVAPKAGFILTVSPVRHVRDTLELNSVSKAVLRIACHRIANTFTDVEYFPAFEMMVDDLRDYRFYGRDRIHPTEEAEDYIWEKFAETHLDASTRKFIGQWDEILSALNHKPFHPESKAHRDFLAATLAKVEKLSETVDVRNEIELLKSRMK